MRPYNMKETRNDIIIEKILVVPIEDKMREELIQFGHIKRQNIDAPTRRCEWIIILNYKRGREWQKKSWNEVICDT